MDEDKKPMEPEQREPPWKIVCKYWPESYEELRQKIIAEGPERVAGGVAQLEMDLVAHRNNLMYMSEALGRMTVRLNLANARFEKEEKVCKEWFHKADDLEQENIELKAEIRKLKGRGKKGKKS